MRNSILFLAVVLATTSAQGQTIIYESATLGPTGQVTGVIIDDTFYLAARFSLTDAVQVSAVGGHLSGAGFAAIIALLSPSAFPSFLPSAMAIEKNALAGTAFSTLPVITSDDVRIPLSVLLPPGDYALVFGGQGPFGSDPDNRGLLTTNNDELPGASFFFGNAQVDRWFEDGFMGARFVVEGTLVAPATIVIEPTKDGQIRNPAGGGKVDVAIPTTFEFDAMTVDGSTLRFGPNNAAIVRLTIKDVDKDGDLDFVAHFNKAETGIKCGDAEATLIGQTNAAESFVGTDSITTVGPSCR